MNPLSSQIGTQFQPGTPLKKSDSNELLQAAKDQIFKSLGWRDVNSRVQDQNMRDLVVRLSLACSNAYNPAHKTVGAGYSDSDPCIRSGTFELLDSRGLKWNFYVEALHIGQIKDDHGLINTNSITIHKYRPPHEHPFIVHGTQRPNSTELVCCRHNISFKEFADHLVQEKNAYGDNRLLQQMHKWVSDYS